LPTYVVLLNWTDQGVRADRETVRRREHGDALAEKHGARLKQVYWTMGHYDSVAIIEAPDDETVSAMMLELTSAGNLRTSTLRAFDSRRDAGDHPKTRLRSRARYYWAGVLSE
jgi:uncharacterized protein with GYD domain